MVERRSGEPRTSTTPLTKTEGKVSVRNQVVAGGHPRRDSEGGFSALRRPARAAEAGVRMPEPAGQGREHEEHRQARETRAREGETRVCKPCQAELRETPKVVFEPWGLKHMPCCGLKHTPRLKKEAGPTLSISESRAGPGAT